jgi:hypothetical protein
MLVRESYPASILHGNPFPRIHAVSNPITSLTNLAAYSSMIDFEQEEVVNQ